ncbi:glycosyltransferase [Plantibacter sp. MCCC 1A11337]|uniref:glycosyltransferase n=1 Tax=Plantibacter sp. MCCC 1A11337 TaxID=2736644 RepID=UPI0015841709|nr:glycosyltransferase [Plantibacter sp. MCCC 1A11337]NUJ89291.1 glycosyltransferase [Plantibacter sp. MCCC 1A11337]
MPKPRLLVLASTWPAVPEDGTPSFVRDLAIEEAEQFEVLALVPRVPGSAAEEQDGPILVRRYRFFPTRWEDLADGAILENLRARRTRWLQLPFFLLGQLVATRRAVRRFKPDVLHVHWIVPQGIIARVAAARVPKLLTSPGGDIYALDSAPMRRVKRWVLGNADRVTVMNRDMLARAVELGVPAEHARVLPMGTRLPAVDARADSRPDIVPLPEGERPLRILFVGRLVEKKGLHVLLRALRGLPASPAWTLEVGGDGPLRGASEVQAEGLPVTFHGQLDRDALDAAFARADVVVFPSVLSASGDQDGLPVVILDAFAAGACIVVSDLPGLNEAVVDGVSGLIVPPDDEDRLTEVLGRLLADAPLRAHLRRGARERATEYSLETAGARYSAVLHEVLAERAR